MIIDADELRERFDIDSEITDTRLDPAIASASRRLREWVGDEAYDDAADDTPSDEVRAEILANAEAHLAMHFAILGLNTPLSVKGIVATAASAEGKEMRKYLTPADTMAVAEQYLEFARSIAMSYTVETIDGGMEGVYA
ncbi:MAG: hypothetical protein IPM50_02630 [Acidobacteriota bacterium]|nr:MAG: hypothetical protein IPM50_02630 [Acidobacteriota bacterium]